MITGNYLIEVGKVIELTYKIAELDSRLADYPVLGDSRIITSEHEYERKDILDKIQIYTNRRESLVNYLTKFYENLSPYMSIKDDLYRHLSFIHDLIERQKRGDLHG